MKIQIGEQTIYFGTGNRAAATEESDSLPVLMIHGAGFDHSVWVMVRRFFSRHGHQVLAPDLPAHGRSSGPALTSIEAMADWLAELLHHQSVGPVAAVGHSMGSLIATSLATRHPQSVAKLA